MVSTSDKWGALAVLVSLAAGAAHAEAPAGAAHAEAPAAPRVLRRADVIDMAARQNPEVAAARAQQAAAEAVEGQADAARWPVVTVLLGVAPSVKATHAPGTVVGSVESSSSYSLDDLTATLSGSVTVLQPLFTFGKIDERREAARHNVRARAAQVAMTRADVALEAARMYELCAFARAVQRFFEEVEFTLQRNLADTRARVKTGAPDLSDQDVARLEVALRAARIAHHQATAGLERALAGLRAWLGLPHGAAITVPDDAFGPLSTEPTALEDLVELALERRADLDAARQAQAAYEALGRAEAAGWWPDFVLIGGVDAAWTPGRDWLDTRFVFDPLYHVVPFVALGVRWQVWGPMASHRRDEMLAQARRYGHLLEWARVGVPAQVADAWHRVAQARADLAEARGGLHRARQWMVGAAADFAMGLAVSRDVTDAVQGYVTMRLAYADAVRRLNTALAELGHATGTLLDAHSPYAVRTSTTPKQERHP